MDFSRVVIFMAGLVNICKYYFKTIFIKQKVLLSSWVWPFLKNKIIVWAWLVLEFDHWQQNNLWSDFTYLHITLGACFPWDTMSINKKNKKIVHRKNLSY